MNNVNKSPFICVDCKCISSRTSNRQLRCLKCSRLRDIGHMKDYHKKTYIKKGYTLKGVNHSRYKDGSTLYKKSIKETCEFCEIERDNLCVHHIDENRRNNVSNNLITLCRSCHVLVHENPRDSKGRFTKKENNNG